MHDPFGDALAVEMRQFLNQMHLLKYDGTVVADLQRVLVVRNGSALICSKSFFHKISPALLSKPVQLQSKVV